MRTVVPEAHTASTTIAVSALAQITAHKLVNEQGLQNQVLNLSLARIQSTYIPYCGKLEHERC